MSLGVRIVVGLLPVLVGGYLIVLAALGGTGRLRPNRFVGIRTAATTRSAAAFALAQRVAAVPLGAAGVLAVLGGVVLLAGSGGVLAVVVGIVTVVGVLVLVGVGGVVGDRAASAVPEPVAPAACAGVCAGCELVAGCRDRSGAVAEGTVGNRG